jgi:hypothetical protein
LIVGSARHMVSAPLPLALRSADWIERLGIQNCRAVRVSARRLLERKQDSDFAEFGCLDLAASDGVVDRRPAHAIRLHELINSETETRESLIAFGLGAERTAAPRFFRFGFGFSCL